MASAELQARAWGDKRIVCRVCDVPLPRGVFSGTSAVCRTCSDLPVQTTVQRAHNLPVHEKLKRHLSNKLQEALQNADPQLAHGVPRAIEILGRTPQEVAAECINQIMNPCDDDGAPVSADVRRALKPDYKTIRMFAQMLQDAQIALDRQLENANPFEGLDADQLRAIILQGTLDQTEDDAELRKELIRAFWDRCPTFYDEVLEVAQERELEAVS
jgi:hypothetical protein